MLVYGRDRRQTAAAYATGSHQRELAVFGAFAGVYLENLFALVDELSRAFNIASGTHTNRNLVLALRIERVNYE